GRRKRRRSSRLPAPTLSVYCMYYQQNPVAGLANCQRESASREVGGDLVRQFLVRGGRLGLVAIATARGSRRRKIRRTPLKIAGKCRPHAHPTLLATRGCARHTVGARERVPPQFVRAIAHANATSCSACQFSTAIGGSGKGEARWAS